jgi:hypothetical protein
MTGKRVSIVVLAALAVAAMLLGSLAGCECGASYSSTSLSEATMCKNVDQLNRPIDKTDVFATDTPEIFCSFKYSYAPEDTEIKGQLIYVQSETQGQVNYKVSETSIKTKQNSGYGYFSFTSPTNGWPKGDYVVKLFVDGKEKLTVPFKVQDGTAATVQPNGVPLANIFQEPGYGFTIRYPADWTYEISNENEVSFKSKKGGATSGVIGIKTLMSAKMGGKYEDVDAVMNDTINGMKVLDANAQITKVETLTYTTEGGQQMIGKTCGIGYTQQGQKLIAMLAVIPRIDGEAFHFVFYIATPDIYTANMPTVEAILKSLTLEKLQ